MRNSNGKIRFFVTGANGQLGTDLVREILGRNYECVGSDITENFSGAENFRYVKLDITNHEQVEKVIEAVKPDRVIHCAAWTAVDAAEDEANKKIVRAVNVTGTENIAKACRKNNCVMTYISTDYVFHGNGVEPWKPDEQNFEPLNFYGQSKLDGEFAVRDNLENFFIVRIAWAFGANGRNFVETMLNLAKRYDTLRVVNDQIGTPTYTPDLARLLVDINETDKFGIYHATNEGGFISWYDFACEIFRQANVNVNVIPVTTEEYGLSKAKRPFNSRLDKSKLQESGFELLPAWQNALRRYLEHHAN